ncbi:MAG: hypothetical protein M3314_04935 [Actinomycetota bacterium]|nr:hypothetical protein [Actinomycetota bacterium]
MITFLLTVAVVGAAIAAAVVIAMSDPDQPAMLRVQPRRERPPRRPRQQVTAPATLTVAEPPERAGGFSDQWIPAPAGMSIWVRVRSGFVLTVLLAVLGALLAVSVSGMLLLIALAVRNAVG